MKPLLRYDVTTGDWLILAEARAERPNVPRPVLPVEPATVPDYDPKCPFCVGNDAALAEIIDEEPDPADPARWSVRLVANKYPVVRPELTPERRLSGSLFREMDGHGRHEVLIETPHHGQGLADQSPAQIARVLTVLHRRSRVLGEDRRLEVVQIFKNSGAAAGSSQVHSHFQLIATPIVPRQIRIKFETAAEHYQITGSSVYVELYRAEIEAGVRLVAVNDEYVAFTPFASRTPYEIWILPRDPVPTFDLAQVSSLPVLAELLSEVMRRLRAVLDDPPYNLIINSSPRRHADEPDFVWHIEIVPRVSHTAGFELATGTSVNFVSPEVAAERLRAVEL
jgi:UDPglucose--hexose-1-phosphate uridylyltransferase